MRSKKNKFKYKLLLTKKDIKPSFKVWQVGGVLNPAAIRLPNKKIMLYARVAEIHKKNKEGTVVCPVIVSKERYEARGEKIHKGKVLGKEANVLFLDSGLCKLTSISHLRKVILDESGMNVEKIAERPTFTGTHYEGDYGVEDARFTKIGSKYYMTYVTVSTHEGVSTSLAESIDLKKWKRRGIIFREQNKDAMLFPEKINGKYVALHRPEGFFEFSKPSIWISHSPDLTYWGEEKTIIHPRPNSWESERIGAGAPPIKTKKGWLCIYHGVEQIKKKNVYSAGAMLLDLKNPEKVLARSSKNKPLLTPSTKHEKSGFVDNVVFPTGAILSLDKKDLLIYSGGADSVITVRKIPIEDIMKNMGV